MEASHETDPGGCRRKSGIEASGRILVYVTAPPPQVGPEPLWHDAASWQVEQKEYGDAVLREISTRCAEKGRIDVETRVEEGPVAETLAKLAGAAEVDFVAVGHRGRGNESVEFRSRTTLCGRVGTGSCVGCHRNSVCWASRSASPGAGVRRR